MNLNSINLKNTKYPNTSVLTSKKKETVTEKENINQKETAVQLEQDTFSKGSRFEAVTYQPNRKLNHEQIKALQSAEQTRIDGFNQMIRSMVVKQGQASNFTLFGMDLFVTPEQSVQAAASIAEGGEYSVDAVATRIMDMAKALAGKDASKIDLLRNAVEKGFEAAGVVFGGELPEISKDTHTEVMNRFDEWKNEFQKMEDSNHE